METGIVSLVEGEEDLISSLSAANNLLALHITGGMDMREASIA